LRGSATEPKKVLSAVKIETTAILGAGGWGTALAAIWAKDGRDILLWGHARERVERLKETRVNHDYLPSISLPANVRLTSDLDDCASAGLVVFVVPSIAFRGIATSFKRVLGKEDSILLSCTKGIEHTTGLRMSQILAEVFPGHTPAVLSGPNLAAEVARGLPTATVLGCADEPLAESLQGFLGNARFRVYRSDEVIGIELGGALKNVFAIPAGICDGLGLGDNSKAALVTRALAELLRLGGAMGGRASTFYGLSGAGDLMATCFSRQSRNRLVGERLGRGESLSQITSSMKMVAEGVPTAKSAFECARGLKVETPIIDEVYALLYKGKSPMQSLEDLMQRDQKSEKY
jgi:glycerol-3-phosphate dehydrogenase (NAD(P)+)